MGAVALLVLAFTISRAGAQPAQAAAFAQDATSASAHVYVYNYGIKFAYVYNINVDGCIETDVDIRVDDYIQQENIFPKRVTEAFARVFISQFDRCTNSLLLAASSPDDEWGLLLESSDFQVQSHLNMATLDATLTLFDSVTSEYIDVDVDLTWTPTGPIISQNGNYHQDFGLCQIESHGGGSDRPAEVSGTITTGMTSFTVESSDAEYSIVHLAEVHGGDVYFLANCHP
jgi:hypothetical protein